MQTLNSFRVNEKYGIRHFFHKSVGWHSPEISIHIARDHSKEKAAPPVKLSFRGGDQSTIQQNAVNYHTFHKDHRQLTRQMHSSEEGSCSQTRNAQTQRESWGRQHQSSLSQRQKSSWALHPKPFPVNANDNSTKQREAPVGHNIWATDTTHPPIHSSSSQWRGPPSPPRNRFLLSHANF
ncbi:hypothetical protein TcCL_ESM07541 [Trypanosoma cruzi]|nr:hypothetical protein TcCL_ESM07541 [Trypanosoma cruzi]